MRNNIWYKLLVALGAFVIIVGTFISVYEYLDYSSEQATQEALEEYKQSQVDAEDLVIEIPEPYTEGYLTVFDSQGVTHFQYSGDISIENDEKNGRPIEIYVYVSEDDPAYQLP